MRFDQRSNDQLRPVTFTRQYTRYAEGAVLVEFGNTKVLCTASVESSVPRFLKGTGQGWITAEYGMLPRSTHTRNDREAARGKQSGRTQEIQRLIAVACARWLTSKSWVKTPLPLTVMYCRLMAARVQQPLQVAR